MKKVIRKEVTIEVEGDFEEAQKEKRKYEQQGYTVFEENNEWIQLDKCLTR